MMLPITIAALALATTICPSLASKLPLPYRVVHEFPLGTWLENVHPTANGDILVTVLQPNASLYRVSDPTGPSPVTTLVHTFDEVGGLLGLVETAPDVFVTYGGNFSNPGTGVSGSFAVFQVDLRNHGKPAVRRIAKIPEALFLNGAAVVPENPAVVLIDDSTLGLVFRLDTRTGKYSVAVKDKTMAVVPGSPFQIGINGLKVYNGHLYWTNSFEAAIYRLRVNREGVPVPGARPELVAKIDAPFLDDLVIGPKGRDIIWVATNAGDTVIAVQPNGKYQVIEGSNTQLTVAGATAGAFGTTPRDYQTLYVVTTGGLAGPVNGTAIEGGALVAIDTSRYEEIY